METVVINSLAFRSLHITNDEDDSVTLLDDSQSSLNPSNRSSTSASLKQYNSAVKNDFFSMNAKHVT
jgi:hypothetical protein